ncbi:ParB N-terminal domain-containing protein [Leucobacter coleopterorum]|uniref:ParB N-terminal domain-containing protein n=1 Tax=Leucobacter coleopterorum TaxID=2714933 RepID=A0ABX6JXK0_9MICO|nr:ParB N-terminal domain-containing protein [Leucobacter coleopterorum]QIM18691.1 ParB N-terminal domain-containing protein [Leucobacter coleopterorum]
MSEDYGIQLDRALDSLRIPDRYRTDLGDLELLAESMRDRGLLQPPTVTPEGIVLIGARRVAAARLLGWKVIGVWVRSGLSDRVGFLIAEHADHSTHKPLNPIEAAGLYRELKAVFAEAAALREQATWFGHNDSAEGFGVGDSPTPNPSAVLAGRPREQAARLVTGRDSSQMLERVCRIEDLAADDDASEQVRAQAQAELELIRNGAGVHLSHLRMSTALTLEQLDLIAANDTEPEAVRGQARKEAVSVRQSDAKAVEMERLAKLALQRVKVNKRQKPAAECPRPVSAAPTQFYSARSFLAVWGDLADWWLRYDLEQIARELSDEDIDQFLRVVEGSRHFADQLQAARSALAA